MITQLTKQQSKTRKPDVPVWVLKQMLYPRYVQPKSGTAPSLRSNQIRKFNLHFEFLG